MLPALAIGGVVGALVIKYLLPPLLEWAAEELSARLRSRKGGGKTERR